MYFNGLQRMRMFSYLFAHMDAVSTLWQESLIIGIWGAVWFSFPALILVSRMRRRTSIELTLPPQS